MKNNCFYFGVYTPDGICSLMSDSAFCCKKNYVADGDSPAVKQQLFSFIKAKLDSENISYTDLRTSSGSGGIFCPQKDFKITDSVFSEKSREKFSVISLENYQKFPLVNTRLNEAEKIKKEREKELLRAQRFLAACRIIKSDLQRLKNPYVDHTKTNRFALRIWQRISNGMNGHAGTEKRRFVTCLSPDGNELNMDAFDIYCEKMLVIRDSVGMCAEIIINRLRRYAIGSGYDVISCPCPINTETVEHLIIPELGFGVFTSKYYHRDDFENSRIVYAKRFLLRSAEEKKQRIDFSRTAYKKLMDEAFYSLKKCEECDKKLDEIFYDFTDLDTLNFDVCALLEK